LKTRKDKEEKEKQYQLVEQWYNAKPERPKVKQPKSSEDGFVGLAILFVIAGLVVGGICFLWIFNPLVDMTATEWIARFFAPLIGALLGIVAWLCVFMIDVAIYSFRMRRSGWSKYFAAVEHWKLVGDEDFGEWAYTNARVAITLSVINDRYMDRFAEAQLHKRSRREEKKYLDDELGDLERTLDNASPGPVSNLRTPTDRKLKWSAQSLGSLKRITESKGERFLVEISFPMERTIGANSAGWISSSGISDREEADLVRRVRKIYESQGLRVSRCRIGWTGMRDSPTTGTREFFSLVIRLA
jgi:hypothetical protein